MRSPWTAANSHGLSFFSFFKLILHNIFYLSQPSADTLGQLHSFILAVPSENDWELLLIYTSNFQCIFQVASSSTLKPVEANGLGYGPDATWKHLQSIPIMLCGPAENIGLTGWVLAQVKSVGTTGVDQWFPNSGLGSTGGLWSWWVTKERLDN